MEGLDAREYADRETERRFGRPPKRDPVIYSIAAAVGAWIVSLAAFAVADVPARMIGDSPVIVGIVFGAVAFGYFYWRNQRKNQFWVERYAEYEKRLLKK